LIEEGNEQGELARHFLGEGGDGLTCHARSELERRQLDGDQRSA
jgi:hypothetical protein